MYHTNRVTERSIRARGSFPSLYSQANSPAIFDPSFERIVMKYLKEKSRVLFIHHSSDFGSASETIALAKTRGQDAMVGAS